MDVCNSTTEQTQKEVEVLLFFVAGVKYRPPSIIESLRTGDAIKLKAEPTNAFDQNAIAILNITNDLIGYVPKKLTGLLHLLRRVGVKLTLALTVNANAHETNMLLVRVTCQGNENNQF